MDGYISIQAAIDALTIQRILDEKKDRYKKGIAQGLNYAIASLSSIPPADVRPVVRGRWEDCSSGWMCSMCAWTQIRESNFCPNCGADMRE